MHWKNLTYRIFTWQQTCIAVRFNSPCISCSSTSTGNFSVCLCQAFLLQLIRHSSLVLCFSVGCIKKKKNIDFHSSRKHQRPNPNTHMLHLCRCEITVDLNGVILDLHLWSFTWRKAQNIWQYQFCLERVFNDFHCLIYCIVDFMGQCG